MDFRDESYRRLYTRRTLTNKRLEWEGRCVMHEMLYEFDRSGVFEFAEDAADCISVVTGLPLEVARLGLERLLKTKTWILKPGAIVWPAFIDAQNCPRSDRLRQQESRERRRDDAMTPVTERDDSEQPVTARDNGHAPSQPSQTVTPSSTFLSTTQHSTDLLSSPAEPAIDAPAPSSAVREVFATWQRVHGHPDAQLDDKRTKRIRSALRLHTAEQLKQAIRGALKDDWLMGRDPKSPRKYDGLETILRDTAKIEALIDLDTGRAKPARRTTNGSLQPDAGRTGDEFFKGIRV